MPPTTNGQLRELGATGLNIQLGRSNEEYHRNLQGERWHRTLAEMITDPVCGGVLFAIQMLVRQVSWQVVPGGDTPEDEADAQFVEECRQDMSASWHDTLAEILSFLPWGWSYLETVYKIRGGDTDDPTQRSRFDDGKIGWRKWSIRSQESLLRWDFDDGGGVQAMVQRTPDWQEVVIPIEKSLLFRTTSRKNDPEGVSILRTAYKPWYYRENIQRIEGIGIERDLAGLPVVWGPPELFDKGATEDQKGVMATLIKIATNIKRDEQEGLVFPLAYDDKSNKKYDVTLLNAGGARQFNTDAIVQRYDLRIAMSVLADFILLGSRAVGSFALATSKTDLFAVALGTWLDALCDVVNSHGIPRLLRLNGRPPIGNLPTLQHGDVEKVDWQAFADAVVKLTGKAPIAIRPEDERFIREKMGWPVPSLEELQAAEEEKAAAAAALQQQMQQGQGQGQGQQQNEGTEPGPNTTGGGGGGQTPANAPSGGNPAPPPARRRQRPPAQGGS